MRDGKVLMSLSLVPFGGAVGLQNRQSFKYVYLAGWGQCNRSTWPGDLILQNASKDVWSPTIQSVVPNLALL